LEDGYFGSGRKLIEAIEEFGVENFERKILRFYKSSAEMFEAERKFVDRDWVNSTKTYNLKIGGHGGWDHENFDSNKQAQKGKKCGKSKLKRWKEDTVWANKMKKICSNNLKQAHKNGLIKYDTFTGKKHSPGSKRRIGKTNSIHQKGEGNSQFGTCWVCKEGIAKKIKIEELNEHLSNGYSKGRK